MKTYLVTGAAGFIGANFIKYLLEKKYKNDNIRIIVLDALTYAGNLGTIKNNIDDKRCFFVRGDIRDRELVDKLFKDYKKWQFYYGIDILGRYLYYKDRQQHFTNIALNPFFGVLFRLSKNFSVATEPGFFVKYSIRRDRRSFDPDAQTEWFESRLAKIGFVQLNFHF